MSIIPLLGNEPIVFQNEPTITAILYQKIAAEALIRVKSTDSASVVWKKSPQLSF
jgi:hypothetical protein